MEKFCNLLVISLFCCLILVSCREDTVETGLEHELEWSGYSDEKEAVKAVDALYADGAPSFYGENDIEQGPMLALGGYLSGFFNNESGGTSSVSSYCRDLSIDAVHIAPYLDKAWHRCYDAISNANSAIEKIPQTKNLAADKKNTLLAEARYFRAFNYFFLVKAFGDVPLATPENPLHPGITRSTATEIYALIEEDLKYAMYNLPDKTFVGNGYRICRPVAETLLAHVYLTMSGYPLRENRYAAALAMAKSVMDRGKHALLPNADSLGMSAYDIIRASDNNPELIYAYKNGGKTTVPLSSFTLSKSAVQWGVIKLEATNNAYYPTRNFLNMYDSVVDIRMHERQFFHTFYKYDKENKTIIETFNQTPYMWFDADAVEQTGISDRSIPVYRYAELLLIAAEAAAQSTGVTPEAVSYLAEVRARAYIKSSRPEIEEQLKSLDKERFIEEVWLERLRELPFEMRVWDDIQRTHKYPLSTAAKRGSAEFVNVVGTKNPLGKTFEVKHLLLPIPLSVTDAYQSITQNPGYE